MRALTPRRRAGPPLRQRLQAGLSLVEMMVGVAIGLFIVAAASMLVATQLAENRRLLLETQIQQDLRATADIIARELRRAGYWTTARQGVWYAGGPATLANPYRDVTLTGTDKVELAYSRATSESSENNAVDANEQVGFRLSSGVIETKLGAGGWQALTDAATLNVTAFTVQLEEATSVAMACPNDCPGGGEACWPRLTVRELSVAITGQAVSDAAVQRSVRNRVRLRNDLLAGACPP